MKRVRLVRAILAGCCTAALGIVSAGCVNPTLSEDGWFTCSTARPDCPEGFECRGGRCLPVGTDVDSGVDAPTVDGPAPDGPAPDGPAPDGPAHDGPAHDAVQPDAKVPDATQPDAKAPDAKQPDAKVPDATAPDASSGCVHPSVTKSCSGGFCTIPAGCFMMGSPATEPCRWAGGNEDLHQVTLTHDFELQEKEVTQGEFNAAMTYNPSSHKGCGPSCPVDLVSWSEAAAYCNSLSTPKGLKPCYTCSGTGAAISCVEAAAYTGNKIYTCPGYRLPSDAEWEYAYRAGTKTAFYNGASNATTCACSPVDVKANAIGWFCGNAAGSPKPVGQLLANAWGLKDMAGNAAEHCNDYYQASLGTAPVKDPAAPYSTSRMFRGGSYSSEAFTLRAAYRGSANNGGKWNFIGFRCARTLKP